METQKATGVTVVSQPLTNAPKERLFFIDNIRWGMIFLVVLMHLKVTYGDMGLWYYIEPGKAHPLSGLFFGIYGSFVQAFSMGLLFFIAGCFVPGSYDKKGPGRFVQDRLVRLGIPTLVYMVLVHPVTILIVGAFNQSGPTNFFSWYAQYITSLAFLSNSGPLWFALALLVFSLVYALVRQVSPQQMVAGKGSISVTHSLVIAVIAIISIFAFLIRQFQAPGVQLFNQEPGNFMQLGFFSSYFVLFVVGMIAYRQNLLMSIPYKFGNFWFKLALFAGIPLWFVLVIGGGIAQNPEVFFGGFHWQAVGYATWESFFCVGVSLGLLVIFREKYNTASAFSRFLSENAFGVYVFHAPILVAITMSLRGLAIEPGLKMFLMALIVLPACFGFSYLLRKVPLFKKIFS